MKHWLALIKVADRVKPILTAEGRRQSSLEAQHRRRWSWFWRCPSYSLATAEVSALKQNNIFFFTKEREIENLVRIITSRNFSKGTPAATDIKIRLNSGGCWEMKADSWLMTPGTMCGLTAITTTSAPWSTSTTDNGEGAVQQNVKARIHWNVLQMRFHWDILFSSML